VHGRPPRIAQRKARKHGIRHPFHIASLRELQARIGMTSLLKLFAERPLARRMAAE
jgi:hypothetical protein